MKTIRVAVVNWTGIADDDVRDWIDARQQVSDDPGVPPPVRAELELVPYDRKHEAWPGYWGLVLLDGREHGGDDRERALTAYHDRTSDGHPLARVFVDRVQSGEQWTELASRDLRELLARPYGDGMEGVAAEGVAEEVTLGLTQEIWAP